MDNLDFENTLRTILIKKAINEYKIESFGDFLEMIKHFYNEYDLDKNNIDENELKKIWIKTIQIEKDKVKDRIIHTYVIAIMQDYGKYVIDDEMFTDSEFKEMMKEVMRESHITEIDN